MSKGMVLVADDDTAIRTVLTQALTRAGFEVRAGGTAASLWQWVSNGEGDVIVTDVMMPDQNAFDLIPRIKKLRPDLPIIVISAKNTLGTAVTAAEKGAFDYLPKPFDLSEVTDLVQRAVDLPSGKRAAPVEAGDADGLPLVGGSPAMQEIYRSVARMTQNDLSVLITGESGTGKELVARALHDYGARKRGQFVAINMAAIPRELIESELFGHEKGAFTGANQRMDGRFEQAEGGTLFLDEIGDMPMETQTRLLRVLQEGEYTTIGGRRPIKTDVRIVAATHQDLRRLIRQGLFREDLYFRLNVVPLRLPPLRERLDDIEDLVRHFMAQGMDEGLVAKSFDNEALDALRAHSWPGNVRELENLVRRLCALYVEDVIDAQAVRLELSENDMEADPIHPEGGSLTDSLHFHLSTYFKSHGQGLPPNGLYERVLREVETPLIELSLEATRGNQIKAAELLGLNRNTLRKKIRELDIDVIRGSKK
jgi:two-component system nitrogen regulation response regulator GlnG